MWKLKRKKSSKKKKKVIVIIVSTLFRTRQIVDHATMTDYTAADKSFNPSLQQNQQDKEQD